MISQFVSVELLSMIIHWSNSNIKEWEGELSMLSGEEVFQELYRTARKGVVAEYGNFVPELEAPRKAKLKQFKYTPEQMYTLVKQVMEICSKASGYDMSLAKRYLLWVQCNSVAVRTDGQAFDLFLGRAVRTSIKGFHLDDLILVDYAPGFNTVVAGWERFTCQWEFATLSRETITADRERYSFSRGQMRTLQMRINDNQLCRAE